MGRWKKKFIKNHLKAIEDELKQKKSLRKFNNNVIKIFDPKIGLESF